MPDKIYLELTKTQLNIIKVALISQTMYITQALDNMSESDSEYYTWAEEMKEHIKLASYIKEVGKAVA